jgi:hypothetical protein
VHGPDITFGGPNCATAKQLLAEQCICECDMIQIPNNMGFTSKSSGTVGFIDEVPDLHNCLTIGALPMISNVNHKVKTGILLWVQHPTGKLEM